MDSVPNKVSIYLSLCEAKNLFNLFTTCHLYRLRKAYFLIILALETSKWSQITFYILGNVLTSIFERFGPNS